MRQQRSRKKRDGQPVVAGRQELSDGMAVEGFTPGTQKAYGYAFDRFARSLKGASALEATVGDAKRYLAGLKRAGATRNVYGNASAALKFFFVKVRGLDWEPVSPLRRRMIEDMRLHGFSPRTQDSYVRSVLGLACYYQRSPDQIVEEEIRRYFVHLTCERKLARKTITIALCGVKFFYEKTLRRDWSLTGVPVPKREKKLPVVLTRKEVGKILAAVRVPRLHACLTLIYACGLRLSEGCRVEVTDIDRQRGLLHVHGKGSKDRYVPLPAAMLPILEAAWKTHRNRLWLFPWVGRGARQGQQSDRHTPLSTVQQAFRKALIASGIGKKVSVHSLRHAYATHLLEAGIKMPQIQQWLGHSSPSTTAIYAHLTQQSAQADARVACELMNGLA
jgi:site-specific recombinase XerD